MNNFGVLYRYEMKKLMRRKIVWIAGAVIFALSLMSVTSDVSGKYYVDGVVYDSHYHLMEMDREYARKLNGRAINLELIEEMQAAYAKVPTEEARYSLTDEYQTYARSYSQIFQIVRKVMRFSNISDIVDICAWEADEAAFYDAVAEIREAAYTGVFLTEGEKAYWRKKAEAVSKPFVFAYADGYWKLISSAQTISFMMLLFCTICLSDMFTKEHVLRTDQLLLSSRFGKRRLYFAKVAAGMSFTLISTFGMAVIIILTALGIYGADGFGVAIQINVVDYPLKLSAGTAVIMMYALMILAALLTAAFVMMLSEFFGNAAATLATVFGVSLIPFFVGIPAQFRVVAQLWDYLPGGLLNADRIMGLRLLPLFGGYLTIWQAVPLLYILLGTLFICLGMRAYRNYQVSGR
ncbi:MAG: ABC transporter permease subunit [Bacillus sp. (in: Bacteria)]|nr:ABC transporter permease subunit [Bacillus sp. (in: firmicutes)]MCM1427636.1 ABC transporter permease subunit [Eubacterium sp.]